MDATRVCSFEDCGRPHSCRGYCRTHYEQFRTTGAVKKIQPWDRSLPPVERFWQKVNKTAECWEWQGAVDNHGYGFFNNGKAPKKAHRHSYEMVHGKIDPTLDVDHSCRNRRCVNPSHLRPATRKQNVENHGGAQSNSATGVRGVSWHSKNSMWRARVHHNGAERVRYFKEFEEAARAVVEMRNLLFTHNDLDRP